jgi:hypothetical protein
VSDTCGACKAPLATHPWCCLCRCLTHGAAVCRYDPQLCADCDALLARRGLRRCKACEQIKPLMTFHRLHSGNRGRTCFACLTARYRERKNARERERRAANLEAQRARSRRYYAAHRAERQAVSRQRYHADPARHYERCRRWRAQNWERYLSYGRAWRKRHLATMPACDRARRQRKKLAAWFGRPARPA